MRISKAQKELVKKLAKEKSMSMTQYVWHLITKDKENNI